MEVIYNWKYREISGNVSTTFKYVEGGPDYKAPEGSTSSTAQGGADVSE